MADYYRPMPHFHPDGAYLFITWRLFGTLPVPLPDVIYATPGHRFAAEDRAFVHAMGPLWLADTRVAVSLAGILVSGDRERSLYELCAWVIMPNHVHVLILPNSDPRKIFHWIKGRSAKEANSLLGLTGPFWQHESYDRYIRSRRDYFRVANYLEENPVSAGFVNAAADWRFSSASRTS